MSDDWAPALFFIGVLALASHSCDGRNSSTRVPAAQVRVPEYHAPPAIEAQQVGRSDCEPGAPPSSLANALDVLRARCDRARAIAIVAGVASLALPGGAARGALVRTAASRASLARAGAAGAAADGALMTERVAATAARSPRAYRVTPTQRNSYEVSPLEEGRAAGPSYDVEAVDNTRFRVSSRSTSGQVTVDADHEPGVYSVKPTRERSYRIEGRRDPDAEVGNEAEAWEYKPR